MELKLPSPALVVLIGPSASGKSTWASEHFERNEIVSSDALRATVGAGEDDQVVGTLAFDLLDRLLTERLRRGMTTVVDALGFDADLRRGWIATAATHDIPAHAVVSETPRDLCEERNAERLRPIPATVLRKQLSRFKTVQSELHHDGFDTVHRVISEPRMVPIMGEMRRERHAAPRQAGHTFGLIVSRFD